MEGAIAEPGLRICPRRRFHRAASAPVGSSVPAAINLCSLLSKACHTLSHSGPATRRVHMGIHMALAQQQGVLEEAICYIRVFDQASGAGIKARMHGCGWRARWVR